MRKRIFNQLNIKRIKCIFKYNNIVERYQRRQVYILLYNVHN